MDSEKNTSETEKKPEEDQQAPADALSRTPEDLEQEREQNEKTTTEAAEEPTQELSPIKRFFRKVNVYFLVFFLLIVVAGAVAIVNYLNSQKASPEANITNQGLTQETLKQLANTDASVGNTSQTLTIKGNAIVEGQTLARGALNVAGDFQTGGSIQGPSLTISGSANLGEAQINSLQVATNTAIQGSTTLRDLNVAGSASFGGALTASQITVTRLILSGNATLQIPNHISFEGAPANRSSINPAVLGGGGTASLSGTDTSGTVNISTGHGTSAGCFVEIRFAQPYNKQPRVIVSPVNSGAGLSQYYVTRNNVGFSICTAAPAPPNQSFAFDYFVAG